MEFRIEAKNGIDICDDELSGLLKDVYIGEGYAGTEHAETLFNPDAIRSRGKIITASHLENQCLAGVLIMVPPTSKACKRAKDDEVEAHLLAVKKEYRKNQLGENLMNELIQQAKHEGYRKVILWTQASMLAAQSLYTKLGFIHESNFNAGGREFLLYGYEL